MGCFVEVITKLQQILREPALDSGLQAWWQGQLLKTYQIQEKFTSQFKDENHQAFARALLCRLSGRAAEGVASLKSFLRRPSQDFPSSKDEEAVFILSLFEQGLCHAALGEMEQLPALVEELKEQGEQAKILSNLLAVELLVAQGQIELPLKIYTLMVQHLKGQLPEPYQAFVQEGICLLKNTQAFLLCGQTHEATLALKAWNSRHSVPIPKQAWGHKLPKFIHKDEIRFLEDRSLDFPMERQMIARDVAKALDRLPHDNILAAYSKHLQLYPFLPVYPVYKEDAQKGPCVWAREEEGASFLLRVLDISEQLKSRSLKLFFSSQTFYQALQASGLQELYIVAIEEEALELQKELKAILPDTTLKSLEDDVRSLQKFYDHKEKQSTEKQNIREQTKLKIVLYVPMDTVYIRHAMGDLVQCLHESGHEVEAVELTHRSHFTFPCFGAGFRPLLEEDKVDLIILANGVPSSNLSIPDWVPSLSWIQDPIHFQKFKQQSKRSWLVGAFSDHAEYYKTFRPEYLIPSFCPVYEASFSAHARSQEGSAGGVKTRSSLVFSREEAQSDITFITNAARKPQEIFQSFFPDDVYEPWQGLVKELEARIRAGHWDLESLELESIIENNPNLVAKNAQTHLARLKVGLDYIGNTLRRQAMIRTCLGITENLAVYGKGWEEQQDLKAYHKGFVAERRELSALYRESFINIEPSGFEAFHPRLSEGIFSGGFFLIFIPTLNWGIHENYQLALDVQAAQSEVELRDVLESTPQEGLLEWQRFMANPGDILSWQAYAKRLLGLRLEELESFEAARKEVAFSSPQELSEKIVFFLEQPEKRAEIYQVFLESCRSFTGMAGIFDKTLKAILS